MHFSKHFSPSNTEKVILSVFLTGLKQSGIPKGQTTQGISKQLYSFFPFFREAVLGFELRDSWLLRRCSTPWAVPFKISLGIGYSSVVECFFGSQKALHLIYHNPLLLVVLKTYFPYEFYV
jgi:hypothetical protein